VSQNGWTQPDKLDSFDCTLANLAEVVLGCLDAAEAKSVVEVGAENGLFTRELLAWGKRVGADRIVAIDPDPRPLLAELDVAEPTLELIRETSHAALAVLEPTDAVILDGDHNYFTVAEELRLIAERSERTGANLPLILLHDIGWPLAHRDSYHNISGLPADAVQTGSGPGFLDPTEPGLAERGLYYECIAPSAGGPRNGVLTAVEDFLSHQQGLRFARVPQFFGLGVVWPKDAKWAGAVAAVVKPWDSNPTLERAESKRVEHLVAEFRALQQIDAMRSQDYELQELLSTMLKSSAFTMAERLSRLKQGGKPMFTRDQVAAALARAREDNDLLGEQGSQPPADAAGGIAPAGDDDPAPATGLA
jgi:phospholipid N-methyltransferase